MNTDKFRAYLETGNIVMMANGRLGVVLGDVIIIAAPHIEAIIAEGFSKYTTDLFEGKYMEDRVMFGPEAETQYRITEIWRCNSDRLTLQTIHLIFTGNVPDLMGDDNYYCLYDEKEDYVVPLTVDEISKRLGYRIRIVSGSEPMEGVDLHA